MISLTGIFAGRQHLADLADERFPGPRAPEVVDPEEAALQQIVAQALGILGGEAGAARIRRHHERALRTARDRSGARRGDWDRSASRPTCVLVSSDRRDREIDVGVGIVGAPAEAALLAAHLPIHQAAEVPRAVEVGRRWEISAARRPRRPIRRGRRTRAAPRRSETASTKRRVTTDGASSSLFAAV